MNVPFHKQTTDYMCAPTVIQMIFEYFGKHEKQETLAKDLKSSPERGTSHVEMVRCVREYGFKCYAKTGSSIDDIRHFLDQKIPVIVNYIEPCDETGHYAIAVEANDTELFLNDPWNGERFRIGISEFEKRWQNSTGRSKRWLMVISPAKISKLPQISQTS